MADVQYKTTYTTGPDCYYDIFVKLLANGWETVAWSNATTRVAGASPAAAADLDFTNAWWLIKHTATGHHLGIQRGAASTTWASYVTPSGKAMSGGNATTMDNNATYSKTRGASQMYPITNATTKVVITVSNSTPAFKAMARRSPHPGGSTDGCMYFSLDYGTDLSWAANPFPLVFAHAYSDGNVVSAQFFADNGRAATWLRLGIAGEAWVTNMQLDNMFWAFGSATVPQSGVDQSFATRWGSPNVPGPTIESAFLRGHAPYRNPIVGVDAGGTLTRGAFGGLTIPNLDGVALSS